MIRMNVHFQLGILSMFEVKVFVSPLMIWSLHRLYLVQSLKMMIMIIQRLICWIVMYYLEHVILNQNYIQIVYVMPGQRDIKDGENIGILNGQ